MPIVVVLRIIIMYGLTDPFKIDEMRTQSAWLKDRNETIVSTRNTADRMFCFAVR